MPQIHILKQLSARFLRRPRWIAPVASLGIASALLFGGPWESVAAGLKQVASGSYSAKFTYIAGTLRVLLEQDDGSRLTKTPHHGMVLQSHASHRDIIRTAGDSASRANLELRQGRARLDLVTQVGPDEINTDYLFPCQVYVGSSLHGWGFAPINSSSGVCEDGVRIGRYSPQAFHHQQYSASKKNEENRQLAQGLDIDMPVSVTRKDDLTLIYAHALDNSEEAIAIDILVGSVDISSSVGKVTVGAGQRYVYDNIVSPGTITDTPPELPQSKTVQDFLESSNWSDDAIDTIERYQQDVLTSEQQEGLNTHNQWRRDVGIVPLRWSPELAELAQNCAAQNIVNGTLQHCVGDGPGSGKGENLFWASGRRWTLSEVVNNWTEERRYYDELTGQCERNKTCGHYTQVVWQNTREVGCGVARRGRQEIWSCNYDPPGNFRGERAF